MAAASFQAGADEPKAPEGEKKAKPMTANDLSASLVSTHNSVYGVDNQILVPVKVSDQKKWEAILKAIRDFVKDAGDPKGCDVQMEILESAGNSLLQDRIQASQFIDRAIELNLLKKNAAVLSKEDLDYLNDIQMHVNATAGRVATVKSALPKLKGLLSSKKVDSSVDLMDTLCTVLNANCGSFGLSLGRIKDGTEKLLTSRVQLYRSKLDLVTKARDARTRMQAAGDPLLMPEADSDVSAWQGAKDAIRTFVEKNSYCYDERDPKNPDRTMKTLLDIVNKASKSLSEQRGASWSIIKACLVQKPVVVGFKTLADAKEKINLPVLASKWAQIESGKAALSENLDKVNGVLKEIKGIEARVDELGAEDKGDSRKVARDLVTFMAGLVVQETEAYTEAVKNLKAKLPNP
jgi:hypothetical protein